MEGRRKRTHSELSVRVELVIEEEAALKDASVGDDDGDGSEGSDGVLLLTVVGEKRGDKRRRQMKRRTKRATWASQSTESVTRPVA